MQIIRNLSDSQQISIPEIRALVEQRIDALSAEGYSLADVGHIVVIDATDTIATTEQHLGVSISAYELIDKYPCCLAIVYVLDQAGTGIEMIVPKEVGIDPDLLAMCQRCAVRGAT